MGTPKDITNTEVYQMLRDFKHVMFQRPASQSNEDNCFRPYRQSFDIVKSQINETSSVATKLNFSHITDSFSDVSNINKSEYSTTVDVECNNLKRKLESTEADLLVAQAKIKDKEGMISIMEPSYKKARIHLEKDLETCKRQNELDKDKIQELRLQMKFLSSEVTDNKNQLIECEKQKKIECDNLELKVISLQLECSNLKSEIAELRSQKAEIMRKLNTEIGRLELEINSLTEENEQSKSINQTLKRQLNDQSALAVLSCKFQKALTESEAKIKDLENQLDADKDASIIARTMQAELKLLPGLQKENQQLKEELSKHKENNVELFQEKLWNLQEKLQHSEKRCASLVKVQVENEQLREKISEWETLVDDNKSDSSKSPMAFSKKLSHYQRNEIILTNKLTQITLRCENLEALNKKLQATIAEIEKEHTEAKKSILNMEEMLKRNVRKIHILAKERDNNKNLLDTYIFESTLSGAALNVVHIKSLESTIESYKKTLEMVEEENALLENKLKQARENKQTEVPDNSELENLRVENSQLVSKIEEALKLNRELEQKLREAKESTVTSENQKCRVLHLKCNPADQAAQKRANEYKSLLKENDNLRKRIMVLEEEGATAEDITLKVQQKLLEKGHMTTVESLNEKLSKSEKKCKILMDAFQKTSQEFRETCYMLTGYKIEVPLRKKYKLSHMYAESPDDFLLFELSSEGTLNLLESEYSKRQMESIDTYLKAYDSIPAFLSNLTMELFNRQTCVVMQK